MLTEASSTAATFVADVDPGKHISGVRCRHLSIFHFLLLTR